MSTITAPYGASREMPARTEDRVAVLSSSCRLPGARTPEQLWANLRDGVESITRFDADELRDAGVPEDVLQEPNYIAAAPVLDDVDCFDARRFGFTPREAALLDPQQRCFMQCAVEALERAALVPGSGDGAVGVFAGANVSTYLLNNLAGAGQLLPGGDALELLLHNDKDYLATRTAYKLGFTGPAVAVQTACSTSLVAVHLACQSLLGGECDTALAGAVSIRIPHRVGYLYQDGLMFSPDGRCRPFDAEAAGTVFGSGAGVVVLRRLEDALADGDPIEAVILGSAVNNDGAGKVGFTAPSVSGQTEVISAAIAVAGIDAATISAIEAHGTGTPLGDPIELTALRRALGDGSGRETPCAVGAIKANLGHLDTAAGIAGLIKAMQQLRHRELAPTLHYREPNPQLPLGDGVLEICDELRAWESDGPRRIGVSSFGIGGTNAHVILEQPPERPSPAAEPEPRPELIVVSGHSRAALDAAAEALTQELGANGAHPLRDVARTLQSGREALAHRRAVVALDAPDACELLSRAPSGDATHRPRIVFMLPGQGAQYPGMAARLYAAEPVFAEELDACAEHLLEPLGLDLRELLLGQAGVASEPERAERLRQTAIAQPALFAFEYALARLLASWDVRPEALIGHSIGELIAACLAGVVERDAALGLVVARGALMQRQLPGAMLSVALGADQLEPLLGGPLALAAANAPGLSVASGPDAELDVLAGELRDRGVPHHRLHTSHAFHSSAMDAAAEAFSGAFVGVALRAPEIPFVSNLTGTWITPEQATDPGYWARQLRACVRFADGLQCVVADGPAALVEVGPGRILSSLARQGAGRAGAHTVIQAAPGAEADEDALVRLLDAVGRLWGAGVEIGWERCGARGQRITLPPRPLLAERHWVSRAGPGASSAPLVFEMPEPVATDVADRPVGAPFTAPRNDAERRIAALWEEHIGVAPIGVNDDFFELGGHSLAGAQIVAQMRERLGLHVRLRDLVQAPTVAGLAAIASPSAPAQGAGTLATVDQFTQLAPAPAERYEPFALTELQQAQWIGRMPGFAAGGVAAHVYVEFEGQLDAERMVAAWWRVVEQHDQLRAIVLDDGRQQVLREPPAHEIPVLDLASLDESAAEQRALSVRERMHDSVRPAGEWPLWELAVSEMPSGRVRTHLSFDLLLADVASLFFGIMRDWRAHYEQPDEPVATLELSFRDYVIAEHALRDSDEYERALDYWRGRVAEMPPAPELPVARALEELERPVFGRRHHAVAPARWEAFKAQALRHGVTPSVALLSAYAAALATFARHQRFTLNLTAVNRWPFHPDVGRLVGEFASFNLLEVDAVTPTTFAELARQLLERGWADLEHRHVSGVRVLRELARARRSGQGAVMPVVFTSTVGQEDGAPPVDWLGELRHAISQTPQVTIDMFVMEAAGGLDISCHAIEELFPEGVLDALFAAFTALVERLADDAAWVGPPTVPAPATHLDRRAHTNETARELRSGTLVDAVLEQGRRRPSEIALIAGEQILEHGELAGRAVELARLLHERDLAAGSAVGVCLPKSASQIIASLGVTAAGGRYVPIDAEQPIERLRTIAAHARLDAVIAGTGTAATWAELGVPALAVPGGESRWADADLAGWRCPAGPEDLAYVIYTSGSTGVPKGVAVSHRAALNTCLEICDRFGIGAGDRVLGLSSLAFDLSVFDVFGMLGAGGALVLPAPEARRDPAEWERLVRAHAVTVWNSVPALAQMLVEHLGDASAPLPVRVAMLSGDWIPVSLPECLRRGGAPGATVYSLGGATEAGIWSIFHRCGEPPAGWDSVPYGTPLANQRFHVLNERLEPCPELVSGELFIAGAGLADGYFNDPERTAASFFEHPVTGERLYRTGDIGRYREDGVIEFLGREDLQVKVGGYRIELGDIEHGLCEDAEVAAAAVVAHGDRHHRRLVAYVVPRAIAADPAEFSAAVLGRLGERLPAYMIPATAIVLDRLPLTVNGKIDRAGLPAPEHAAAGGGTALDPGLDAVALRFAALVAAALQVDAVDIHDNFFELGGDSILAVQIIARAVEEGIDVVPQDLFEHQTIAALVGALHAEGRLRIERDELRTVPLTPGQRSVLEAIGAGAAPAAGVRLEIDASTFDLDALERALSALAARHDALRLRLRHQPDGPLAMAAEAATGCEDLAHVPELDLRALPGPERARLADEMVADMAGELDAVTGPITKAAVLCLDEDGCELVWLAHRLAVDRSSWPQLVDELAALYAQARAGAALVLPERAVSLLSFAEASPGAAAPLEPPVLGAPAAEPAATERPAPDPVHAAATAVLAAGECAALVEELAVTYRLDLTGAVLAAVASTLRDGAGEEAPLGVAVTHDRREGLRLVGVATLLRSATVSGAPDRDPGSALIAAKRALAEPDPAGEPPSVALHADALAAWRSPADGSLRFADGFVGAEELGGIPAAPLEIFPVIVDGELRVHCRIGAGAGDPAVLAEAIVAWLRDALAHCRGADSIELDAGDFPLADLGPGELEGLLASLPAETTSDR